MTYNKVIKRIQEENEVFSIQFLEDRKNKINGFSVLINTQQFYGTRNAFHGIKQSTLKLFDEAKVKYKILR